MGRVAAGRKGRRTGGDLAKAAKRGCSVFLRASSVVFPVGAASATKRQQVTLLAGKFINVALASLFSPHHTVSLKNQRVCVCVCSPVNSVNAHNERLYVRVGWTQELAACLSAVLRAIT